MALQYPLAKPEEAAVRVGVQQLQFWLHGVMASWIGSRSSQQRLRSELSQEGGHAQRVP